MPAHQSAVVLLLRLLRNLPHLHEAPDGGSGGRMGGDVSAAVRLPESWGFLLNATACEEITLGVS
jgi:hypothetical protein